MNHEPLSKSSYDGLLPQPDDTIVPPPPGQAEDPSKGLKQTEELAQKPDAPSAPNQPSLRHGLKMTTEALRNDAKEVGGKLEEMAKDATEVMRSGFSNMGKAIGKWLGVGSNKS